MSPHSVFLLVMVEGHPKQWSAATEVITTMLKIYDRSGRQVGMVPYDHAKKWNGGPLRTARQLVTALDHRL